MVRACACWLVFFSYFSTLNFGKSGKNRQRAQAPNHWVLQDSMPVSKFIYRLKKKQMLWAPNCARLHLSAVFFSFFLDTSEKLKKKQATSASTEPLGAAIFDACIKIYLCKKKNNRAENRKVRVCTC